MKQVWMVVLALVVTVVMVQGCGRTTSDVEVEKTESNQERLLTRQPPPIIDVSLERTNLINRLERLNKDDMVSYIYLISFGKIMANYTVKGKVSSLNSLLTTPEQISWRRKASGWSHSHVIPSPDFDGSYGRNADGIFFFTTEGAYVEWAGGLFMVGPAPQNISAARAGS